MDYFEGWDIEFSSMFRERHNKKCFIDGAVTPLWILLVNLTILIWVLKLKLLTVPRLGNSVIITISVIYDSILYKLVT